MHPPPVFNGAGLGLRRAFMTELVAEGDRHLPDFYEIAPENWIGMGGRYAEQLQDFCQCNTVICHGLSLSIGGFKPLDREFLRRLKDFMGIHGLSSYSEHLSYSGDEGHLYDLLPIPFTEAAVVHVADRIRQVQDYLGMRLALENVSYYTAPGSRMSELEFLLSVLDRADCDLLLDVNNVRVNAVNHGYDAVAFLQALPGDRIRYLHVAGHHAESETLCIDTHGEEVSDPVWDLLALAYRRFGVLPTLLERDFHIPPLSQLLDEVDYIRYLQADAGTGGRDG